MFALEDIPAFLPDLLRGAGLTILVSVLAFALALIVGLAFAVLRMSRLVPLRVIAAIYIQFIRGTPLLLQLFFIYYVLPYSGVVLSPFVSAVIGLTANYAAYMAEVFRSGIEGVDPGQVEAAQSLGMSRVKILWRVVLPQAFKIALPPYGNTCVMLLKDTSQASIITVAELSFQGKLIASSTFKNTEVFTLLALMYLVMCFPLIIIVGRLEKRLGRQ